MKITKKRIIITILVVGIVSLVLAVGVIVLLINSFNNSIDAKYIYKPREYNAFIAKYFANSSEEVYDSFPRDIDEDSKFFFYHQPPFMQGGETLQLLIEDQDDMLANLKQDYQFVSLEKIDDNRNYPTYIYRTEEDFSTLPEDSECAVIKPTDEDNWNHGSVYSVCTYGDDLVYYISNW